VDYVKILSDSQAALLALNQNSFKSQAVYNTALKLNELASKSKKVTLVWIKAHVGHEGNEKADQLAKDATMYELL
jgi:ribonuclease HI